jgi:hypothetical protein
MIELTMSEVLTNQPGRVDEACSGGVVHRRTHTLLHGLFINTSLPSSAFVWYERQWRMLVRRLRYPNSPKARKARERILRYWVPGALDQAEAEARGT